jgi:hypothetical protein
MNLFINGTLVYPSFVFFLVVELLKLLNGIMNNNKNKTKAAFFVFYYYIFRHFQTFRTIQYMLLSWFLSNTINFNQKEWRWFFL